MKKVLTVFGVLLLIIAVALVFAIWLRPNLIVSKAETKERYKLPESKFIYWNGTEMHYTDTGAGPPIIMIHGFGGSFYNFEPLAHLMQNKYRVICVDLPGFGMSDLPENHPQGFVPLYRSYMGFLIDHLHLDSVYMIGNSMGGWMAWEMATTRPDKVKKLVLIGSAGYDTKNVAKNLGVSEFLKNPIVGLLAQRGMPMFQSVRTAHKIRDEHAVIDMEEVKLGNAMANRKGNLQNLLTLINSGETPDTAKIAQVKCPTLVLWGKQDKIVPAALAPRFTRDIANSKLLLYDNCGHVPMLEYPEQVAKDVEEFFAAKP